MTDKEKLVEILERVESAFYWSGADKGFIEKIAAHLIDNGVTFQKWIPVTEMLPEKGVNVIALGSRGGVYTAQYKGSIYWHKLNARNHMCEPTHWMPLPEPPKEEV